MQIAGTAFPFQPYGEPKITSSILWTTKSNGYPSGSDRGAAQDVYEAKVTFAGLEAAIDTLQTTLQANREGVALTAFSTTGQEIFGPEVSYAGTINATVTAFEPRVHIHHNKVSEVTLTFRAISPTLLGTTASLATLRRQEEWEGDQGWTVGKAFSYNQTAVYSDPGAEVGTFTGTFSQKPAEARAILAYLLTTARANSITLPTFSGMTYPFGTPRGAGPFQVKIPKWELSRNGLNRWVFRITFTETI